MKALLKKPLLLFIVLALVVVLGFVVYRRFWYNKAKGAIKDKNIRAFLDVIAYSDGGDYDYLFGSRADNDIRFTDFSQHPNIVRTVGGLSSTAAGRYQILYSTWAWMGMGLLGLTDFSKASQDLCAVGLIYYRGALQDVIDGNFEQAIYKCRKEWASFPGANYAGQGMRSIESLKNEYENAGGEYHPQ